MAKLWEDLVNNINIVSEIENFVDLTKKGQNYVGICPFHNDNNPSFTVNPEKKIFKCFVCGTGGNVLKFDQLINNHSFEQSMLSLGKKYNFDVSSLLRKNMNNPLYNDNFKKILELNENVSELFELELEDNSSVKDYLKNRNLSKKVISEFNIGYKSNNRFEIADLLSKLNVDFNVQEKSGLVSFTNDKIIDFFSDRIMIPIRDEFGNIVGFGSRTISKDESIKYLNTKDSEIFKKREILFNHKNALDDIRSFDKNELIVVEGYMDVISLSNNNIKNVVGVMTNNITKEQVAKLIKTRKNIILCLDSDNAGINGMISFVQSYSNLNMKVVLLKSEYDPDEFITEFGREKFISRIIKALTPREFIMWANKNGYDTKSTQTSNNSSFIDNTNHYQEDINDNYVPYSNNMEEERIVEENHLPNNYREALSYFKKDYKKLSYELNKILRHEFTIMNWIICEKIGKDRAQEYVEVINNTKILNVIKSYLNGDNDEVIIKLKNIFSNSFVEEYDEDLDSIIYIILYNWKQSDLEIQKLENDKKMLKDGRMFNELKSKIFELSLRQRFELLNNDKKIRK